MDLQPLAEQLLPLCRKAGEAILQVYQSTAPLQIEQKTDASPLTIADQRAEAIIVAGLQALAPQWPIVSEEQPVAPYAERRHWQRYWLVDPLDGTREFIDGTGEFTVNIALIEQGVPVLGVVYVPLQGAAYVGVARCGLALRVTGTERCRLQVNRSEDVSVLRVLTSSRHGGDELAACVQALRPHFSAVQWLKAGSALKFCWLAEGRGEFYPRFSPCSEWDTAAGQAVLEAAGGSLVGLDFQPLRYNQQASLINPHFYALAATGVDWPALLASRPHESN